MQRYFIQCTFIKSKLDFNANTDMPQGVCVHTPVIPTSFSTFQIIGKNELYFVLQICYTHTATIKMTKEKGRLDQASQALAITSLQHMVQIHIEQRQQAWNELGWSNILRFPMHIHIHFTVFSISGTKTLALQTNQKLWRSLIHNFV